MNEGAFVYRPFVFHELNKLNEIIFHPSFFVSQLENFANQPSIHSLFHLSLYHHTQAPRHRPITAWLSYSLLTLLLPHPHPCPFPSLSLTFGCTQGNKLPGMHYAQRQTARSRFQYHSSTTNGLPSEEVIQSTCVLRPASKER